MGSPLISCWAIGAIDKASRLGYGNGQGRGSVPHILILGSDIDCIATSYHGGKRYSAQFERISPWSLWCCDSRYAFVAIYVMRPAPASSVLTTSIDPVQSTYSDSLFDHSQCLLLLHHFSVPSTPPSPCANNEEKSAIPLPSCLTPFQHRCTRVETNRLCFSPHRRRSYTVQAQLARSLGLAAQWGMCACAPQIKEI